MATIADLFITLGSYIFIVLGSFFLFNFLSNGFLIVFIKVKASRGKLVLVKVRSDLQDYFRPGEVSDGWLVFTDSNKHKRRVTMPEKTPCIYRALNVNNIDVVEKSNDIISRNYEVVSTYDAVQTDHLLKRALMRPQEISRLEKIILFVLVIVGILVIISIYMGYNVLQSINTIKGATPPGSVI